MTDTEWMACNADYARAMVRFAREKAQEDGHAELLPLAECLETLVVAPQRKSLPQSSPADAASATDPLKAAANDMSTRYIGRLR